MNDAESEKHLTWFTILSLPRHTLWYCWQIFYFFLRYKLTRHNHHSCFKSHVIFLHKSTFPGASLFFWNFLLPFIIISFQPKGTPWVILVQAKWHTFLALLGGGGKISENACIAQLFGGCVPRYQDCKVAGFHLLGTEQVWLHCLSSRFYRCSSKVSHRI